MARAKLVKKKRKIRLDRIATLIAILSIATFVMARIGLRTYNYTLSIKAGEKDAVAKELKKTVSSLETEINKLEDRERVLAMIEDDGIKTNQNQVIILGDENHKK